MSIPVAESNITSSLTVLRPTRLIQPSQRVTNQENTNVKAVQDEASGLASVKRISTTPPRPGCASNGEATNLRANHFELALDTKDELYRYSVEIVPPKKTPPKKTEKIARSKKRRIFDLFLSKDYLSQIKASIPPASNYENRLVTNEQLQLGVSGSMTFDIVFYNKCEEKPDPNDKKTKVYKLIVKDETVVETTSLMESVYAAPTGIKLESEGETLEALQAALTINANRRPDVVTVGRNSKLYPIHKDCYYDLGGGVVAIKGFSARVHTATARLLVNINVCTSAFYDGVDLATLMNAYTTVHNTNDLRGLELLIRGLRVQTRHTRDKETHDLLTRERSVFGFPHAKQGYVDYGNAKQIKISLKVDGDITQELTVEDYFHREYNRPRYTGSARPDLPVINLGNQDNPTWTPAEYCFVVPGQAYRKKLTDGQTRLMTNAGVVKPASNARRIVGEMKPVFGLELPEAKISLSKCFGMTLTPRMVDVLGLRLNAPKVYLGANTQAAISRGSWNMQNKKFTTPKELNNWSYLVLDDDSGSIRNLRQHLSVAVQKFMDAAKACGMEPHHPIQRGFTAQFRSHNNEKAVEDAISKALKEAKEEKVEMLLVFLPSSDASTYSKLKFLADVDIGIHTVCCIAQKLKLGGGWSSDQQKRADTHRLQYFANVAMKINLKLGGVNQKLSEDAINILPPGKTMIVGIDVSHPSRGSLVGAPSIAGVVASIDKQYTQWPASVRLQRPEVKNDSDEKQKQGAGQEMLKELQYMFTERLEAWSANNSNTYPENIVVYRDGVSESQYVQVIDKELSQMQQACTKLYHPKPLPRMAIIVVGKRHNTRFYPTNATPGDRLGNPSNGTLVDRAVTMHRGWDFFLQAHTCILGTAKPAHYVVIHNEFEEFKNVDALYAFVGAPSIFFGLENPVTSPQFEEG